MTRVRRDANGRESFDEFRKDQGGPLADSLEGADDRSPETWPVLVKRYTEGNLAVHLHCYFRSEVMGSSGDSEASDFCLSFERAKVASDLGEVAVGEPLRGEDVMSGNDCGTDEMQELVTVEVGQTIEPPQGVIVRRPVLPLKRLLPLNECLMLRRQAVNSVQYPTAQSAGLGITKMISVGEDGELPLVIDDLAILFSQVADEMVEGRANLIQGLPDIDTAEWRRRAAHVSLYDKVARLRLEINDNAAVFTVNQLPGLLIDSIQVLFGPRQLENDPARGISHGLYSTHERRRYRTAEAEGPEWS